MTSMHIAVERVLATYTLFPFMPQIIIIIIIVLSILTVQAFYCVSLLRHECSTVRARCCAEKFYAVNTLQC